MPTIPTSSLPKNRCCVILAPPRSCSSVITAAIGSHPDIFPMPQLNIFSDRTVGELLLREKLAESRGHPIPNLTSGICRSLAIQRLAEDSEDALRLMHTKLQERRHESLSKVWRELCETSDRPLVLTKCTEAGISHTSIKKAQKATDYQIVLVRNPLDSIASFVKMLTNSLVASHSQNALSQAIDTGSLYWCQAAENLLQIVTDAILIQSETFLEEFPDSATSLYDILQIDRPASPATLAPEKCWYSKRIHPSSIYENDPSFLKEPALRSQVSKSSTRSETAFIFDSLPDKIKKKINNLCLSYGYPQPGGS